MAFQCVYTIKNVESIYGKFNNYIQDNDPTIYKSVSFMWAKVYFLCTISQLVDWTKVF